MFRELTLFQDCDWNNVKYIPCDLGDSSFNPAIDAIPGDQFYFNNKIYENSPSICYSNQFKNKYIFVSNYMD